MLLKPSLRLAAARCSGRFADVVEQVNLLEFIRTLPEGFGHAIRERGSGLSTGQKQLISFARALAHNPRILILDEATSSLDSESEALIQEGLKYLMKGRTTFVIAHRLSTIRRADQILVVEAGRIVERGTHESLFALGGAADVPSFRDALSHALAADGSTIICVRTAREENVELHARPKWRLWCAIFA